MSTRGLIATVSGSGTTDRLTDGLGSAANLCDETGAVLVSYTYDAFGAVRSQSASSDNYWLFAGEQRDEESGLDYLRARYYDPATGRFLGPDPLGEGYPYARGNPVNFVDPTGLWTICRQWSNEIDPQTGQPICALAGEADEVIPSQAVYNQETGEWVSAGSISAEWEEWEEGDSLCGGETCVTKTGPNEVLVCTGNECTTVLVEPKAKEGTCPANEVGLPCIPEINDVIDAVTGACGQAILDEVSEAAMLNSLKYQGAKGNVPWGYTLLGQGEAGVSISLAC